MKTLLSVVMMIAVLMVSALPAAAQGEQDIVAIAAGDDRFETLVTAVTEAELVETLQGEGPFTVFAPTDDAFAALPEGTLDAVLADKELLTSILTYHVLAGEVRAADAIALAGQEAATVQGEPIQISVEGETVMINEASVIAADVDASNGVIHVIDQVLLPPSVVAAMSETTTAAAEETQSEQDIVAIAAGDDRFETLVTAVTEAGLVETLQGEGPFTVFAPTDDAFAALPAGTLDAVLADKELLTSILTYHVLAGEVRAADAIALAGQEAATVQGEPIQISVEGGTVMINEASVIAADVDASNGVIHVIDQVLLPPSVVAAMTTAAPAATPVPAPGTMPTTGGESLPILPMALVAAGVAILSGVLVLRPRTR